MNNSKNLINDNKLLRVKQPNIISCAVYEKGITPTAYKLLRYGFYLLGELNTTTKPSEIQNKVYFSVSDFYNCLGISQGGQNKKIIDKALDELTDAKCKLKNPKTGDFSYNVWAYTAGFITIPGTKTKVIQMEFNPNLINIMLENIQQYSWIELLTIGKMKNFYSLRIYELIKSFYNTRGKWGNKKNQWSTEFYSIEYLREFFLTGDKYPSNSDFIIKCIKNPIKEINKSCEETQLNFSVSFETKKVGIVKQIRFVATEKIHIDKLEIKKTDSIETRNEKQQIINDNLEMSIYKKKYGDNWEDLKLKAVEWKCKESKSSFYRDCRNEMVQDNCTLEYIKTQIESQQEFDFDSDVNK